MHRSLALVCLLTISCASSQKWAIRGAGAALGLGIHEACHLALGAAFGAQIKTSGPTLEFSGLSDSEGRAVAIIGNACTGLSSEIILFMELDQSSDIAWGIVAFHSLNSFGYAWRDGGDRAHWEDRGGDLFAWQAVHSLHGLSTGARLIYHDRRKTQDSLSQMFEAYWNPRSPMRSLSPLLIDRKGR